MTRPSQNTDRLLLDTARAMVPETGFTGLKIREVARRAGVNLGMFHYHFKSKEIFTRRLLQESYEDFFARLTLETGGPGTPLERLGRALTVVARFGRENRRLLMVLIAEVLRGHKGCADFAKENVPRHAAVIAGLIQEGQRAGLIRPAPLPIAMAFAMGGVGVPNLVITLMERAGAKRPFGTPMPELTELMLSDEAIALRIEIILAGLAAPGGRRS
jgi:AcrR family transcriptional regulator